MKASGGGGQNSGVARKTKRGVGLWERRGSNVTTTEYGVKIITMGLNNKKNKIKFCFLNILETRD